MPDRDSDKTTTALQIEKAVCQGQTLATLPAVANLYLPEIIGTGISKDRLSELVCSDPSIAAMVLKETNSKAPMEKQTIYSAALMLNDKEMQDIFFSAGVIEKELSAARKMIYLHSLATGCFARELCRYVQPKMSADLGYTAGLLHDIGKLAMQQVMPKSFEKILEQGRLENRDFAEVEQQLLGTDHGILGKRLAMKWGFPKLVMLAIWLHHNISDELIETMPEARIARIVGAADDLAGLIGYGCGDVIGQETAEEIGAKLDISSADIDEIVERASEDIDSRAKLLGLDREDGELFTSVYSAAGEMAHQNRELAENNQQLREGVRYFEFYRDFLRDIKSGIGNEEIIRKFALGWQKFFQTGPVCVYTAGLDGRMYEAVAVGNKGNVTNHIVQGPGKATMLPAKLGNKFGVIDADTGCDWLFDQIETSFEVDRSKLVPLIQDGRPIGAVIFEQRYPGDMAKFEESFRIICSVFCSVADITAFGEKQQRYAESFARLASDKTKRREKCQRDEPAGEAVQNPGSVEDSSEDVSESSGILTRAEQELLTPFEEDSEEEVKFESPVAPMVIEPDMDVYSALAELAAGAAHEFNNPLSVISGRAQMLNELEEDEEKKELLELIRVNSVELAGMVEDLLNYANPHEPRQSAIRLSIVLEEAVELASMRQKSADMIDIDLKGADEEVYIDSAQVVIALANILSNSLESYEGQSGPVQVTAEYLPDIKAVRLKITDFGRGMDSESLKKAINPFFSGQKAGRKRGMGLAHASRLIDVNGGKLSLSSNVDAGTTAMIELPCVNG